MGQPGFLNLHTGCTANQWSVLRWTAPASGTYDVVGRFTAGDFGETEAWILRSGSLAAPLFQAAATSINPGFAIAATVAAGETIDFIAGTATDGCSGDTTPLELTITAR
jgi:hypothetical protein